MSNIMYKHTFANIISSFFPNTNIIDETSFKFPPDEHFLNTDFFAYDFIKSINNSNNIDKHKILINYVINNPFITPEIKEKYINIFYKSQVIYNILCKKARLFKFKNSKPSNNDCDLYMNKLYNYKQYLIIDIYDDYNRTLYKFYIFDLIRIIKTSLSYSPNFFSEPKYIKNPYTNIKFTLAQLYNIYYFIKKSNIVIPQLFHQFYLSNFNLNLFAKNYECNIRDYYIKYFFNTIDINKKARLIRKMIYDYKIYLPSISIHYDFPEDKIIKAFNHDLRLYLITKYSLNPILKHESKKKLIINLKRFNRLNPTFGRKIRVISRLGNVSGSTSDQPIERYWTFNENFVTTEHIEPISRILNRRRNRRSSPLNTAVTTQTTRQTQGLNEMYNTIDEVEDPYLVINLDYNFYQEIINLIDNNNEEYLLDDNSFQRSNAPSPDRNYSSPDRNFPSPDRNYSSPDRNFLSPRSSFSPINSFEE